MITCPKCGTENDDSDLRCHSCDEWLLYYEFKDLNKKAEKPSAKAEKSKGVFLPDNLVSEETEEPADIDIQKVLRFGEDSTAQMENVLKDPVVELAFSPVCPNCGGQVKPYEVKCRHCNVVLQDKIIQSRKLKPVWEKMFRDKILQDGKYNDIYGDGEVKLIFRRLFTKGNKLLWYMAFILLFLLVGGAVMMYCAKTIL